MKRFVRVLQPCGGGIGLSNTLQPAKRENFGPDDRGGEKDRARAHYLGHENELTHLDRKDGIIKYVRQIDLVKNK